MRCWKSAIKAIVLKLFILQFVFPIPFARAEEVTWVTVEGTAALADISKTEARSRAIADARRKAVEKVVGMPVGNPVDKLWVGLSWRVRCDPGPRLVNEPFFPPSPGIAAGSARFQCGCVRC